MKASIKTLFLFSVLLFGLISQAQNDGRSKIERSIPLVVTESFRNTFPDKDPVWFSNYQGRYDQKLVYEGKFIFDKRYCAAIYDINGNQVAFAATVEYKELPEKARNYMTTNYPSFAINETLLVTNNQKVVTYEVGIFIQNKYVIFTFTKDGDFMQNTKA